MILKLPCNGQFPEKHKVVSKKPSRLKSSLSVFPVSEPEVNLISRAEQAVGFCLDISSDRRQTDVKLLNELQKAQTQICQCSIVQCFWKKKPRCLIRKPPNLFVHCPCFGLAESQSHKCMTDYEVATSMFWNYHLIKKTSGATGRKENTETFRSSLGSCG